MNRTPTERITFMASPMRPSAPGEKPSKLETATIDFAEDHVVITNRSGVACRLDNDAATALALVLRDRFLSVE